MSNIKHILFDCDGVLVDTEFTAAHKMCDALASQGVTIDIEHYLKVHSGTTFSAILEHYFGDSLSADAKIDLIKRVEDAVAAEVKAIEGIPKLIKSIKTAKSVVSNSSITTVHHALKQVGIEEYFNGRVFSSEQVPRAKPAPDLYLLAISSLRLKPEEVLVVEDSRTGVQAALAAGLAVIGFTAASHILPGHDVELKELGAQAIAESTEELKELLGSHL